MSIFVYIVMFCGMLVVTLTILVPYLGKGDDKESRAIVEYLAYSFFWSMMLISHLRTMCVDPGFIPQGYAQYKEEVLVAPFKSFTDLDKAYDDLRNARQGGVRISAR